MACSPTVECSFLDGTLLSMNSTFLARHLIEHLSRVTRRVFVGNVLAIVNRELKISAE